MAAEPSESATRFRAAVAALQENMEALVHSRGDDARVAALLGDSALLLLELKASSRATHLGVDRYRQLVQDYKKTLDAHHLQLQNLLYRKHHLLREMMLCRDFTIPEVHLVEKNEQISIVGDGSDLASAEQHQARLKLLTDEMQERQRLEETLQTSKSARDEAQQSIEASRTFLAGLPEQLRLVQGSSKQLQAHFATPASETREQYAMSKNLSEPLYVLFRQLDALCSGDGSSAVRVVDSEPFRKTADAVLKGGRGGVGGEEEGRGRKRAKTSAAADASDASSHLLASGDAGSADKLEVDELAVLLTLRMAVVGHGDIPLTIRFQRLAQVNAVTVEVDGLPGRVLSHLFPGDSGRDYPSSQHFHISADAPFPPEAPARPFAWAQWLGGLKCLPESQSTRLEASSRMIFQRLHQRLQTHTLLEAQLSALASLPHPIPVFASAEHLFPPPSQLLPKLAAWSENHDSACLQHFFSSSISQVSTPKESTAAPDLTTGDGSHTTDTFGCRVFTAVFTGHKNKSHEVTVLVTPAYPEVAPRCIIRPAGVSLGTAFFDQNLKDIEVEVNAHYDELVTDDPASWDSILSHQLRRLQVGLDSIKESAKMGNGGQSLRGRNRRQPLAFSAAMQAYFHR